MISVSDIFFISVSLVDGTDPAGVLLLVSYALVIYGVLMRGNAVNTKCQPIEASDVMSQNTKNLFDEFCVPLGCTITVLLPAIGAADFNCVAFLTLVPE
jgi:hypothetical protein